MICTFRWFQEADRAARGPYHDEHWRILLIRLLADAYQSGEDSTILPDPPVVENVVVRPDGMITIQLIGDVPAGGKTTDQVATDVQNRISRFKRGALVTLRIASSTPGM